MVADPGRRQFQQSYSFNSAVLGPMSLCNFFVNLKAVSVIFFGAKKFHIRDVCRYKKKPPTSGSVDRAANIVFETLRVTVKKSI